jgi:hypothetical protein
MYRASTSRQVGTTIEYKAERQSLWMIVYSHCCHAHCELFEYCGMTGAQPWVLVARSITESISS